MLRFFRQIRKTLMEQNNTRTYIYYAIGEVALVMIGILLALQVNNWNQERIESNTQTNLLESVAESLKEDSLLLIQVYDELSEIDQLYEQMFLYVDGQIPADSISNLRYIRRTLLYNPVTMINYPELGNQLLDMELKQHVRFYYQKMDDTFFVIDNFNVYVEDILRPYLGELEVYNYGHQYSSDFGDLMTDDGFILRDELIAELEDPMLQQMLFETGLKYAASKYILSQLQEENAKMIQFISAYLEK